MVGVVIVGAGQAGIALAARLRAKGYTGSVTMIGAEAQPPYQRPPLSKDYLLGDMPLERLLLRPETYYGENDIDLRLSTRVEAIDPVGKSLSAGGETLAFDHLVLATGATPRPLPEAIGGRLPNVFTIRGLGDIDGLRPQMMAGRRMLVVGGGYIGLEAAAVARKLGLSVTLLEAADRILKRVACPETSRYFRNLHEEHGVEILEDAKLLRLTGDTGGVTGAVLGDGREVSADIVVVGIGVTPGSELAVGAGLTVDNGISVDAKGRTSAPGIWAIGDCASFPHGEGRLRLESVGHAKDHGECVADNILGMDRDYVAKPWFWSDQYDVKLQIAGLGTGCDRIVVRPGDGRTVSHWYYLGERLAAVDALNDPRSYMAGKKIIEGGKTVAPELVADPDIPAPQLMKLAV